MKCLIGFAVVLLVLLAFAVWLGWGRQSDWAQASGWSALSDVERNWSRKAAVEYSALQNRPDLRWFGHATLEINWAGQRLVCDPVAAQRVKVAPRFFAEPILDVSVPCDLVLISHAHMDHMDNATLEQMPPTRILLPAGSERFLSRAVMARHTVTPIQLGETVRLGELEIVAVTAQHGGWRYPWQQGLFACGYIIKHAGEALYVAGDTAAGDHFTAIKDAYHPRYAVLPIGAYSPEWFLRIRHLNPEESLDAATQLGAEFVVPYHFGTYRLSAEPMDSPLRRFATAALLRGQKWFLPVLNASE